MRTIEHPLSGALYDLCEDGTIQVVTRTKLTGIFDKTGRWLSGEVRQADPQMCLWIGGAELTNRFQQAAQAVTAAKSEPKEGSHQ